VWFVEASLNSLPIIGGNKGKATFGEFPIIARAVLGSSKLWKAMGLNVAATARNEFSQFRLEHLGDGTLTEFEKGGSTSGKAGRVVRAPMTLAQMADEANKTFRGYAMVGAYAYRIANQEGLSGAAREARMTQLLDDPTSEAWKLAVEGADRATLTDRGGKATQVLDRTAHLLREELPYGRHVARALVPFVHTPIRATFRAMQLSPLGTIGLTAKVASNRSFADTRTEVAQQIVAWTLTGIIASYVGDSDDEETRITGRDSKHPYSIKVGDSWLSYGRMWPIGGVLGVVADGINAVKTGDAKTIAWSPINSVMQMSKELPMVQQMGDLVRVLEATPTPWTEEGDDQKGFDQTIDALEGMAINWAAGWVPNLIRSTIRENEVAATETRALSAKEKLIQRLEVPAALGYAVDNPKIGLFGEVRQQTAFDRPATNAIEQLLRASSPMKSKPVETHPGYRMMHKWNSNPDHKKIGDKELTTRITVNGKSVGMNADQFYRFAELAGTVADKLFTAADFDAENPTQADINALDEIFDASRRKARDVIRKEIETGKPQTITADELAPLVKRARVVSLRNSLERGIDGKKPDESTEQFQARRKEWLDDRTQKRAELARWSAAKSLTPTAAE
jgi:hypothetical protein